MGPSIDLDKEKSKDNFTSMNSGIFISYRYNVKEMDGIEAFQCELSQNYLCQGIGKWIPACSEGVKMWMTMFLTVPIGQFLAECLKDVAKETVIIAAEKHPSNGECCLDAWRFEENKLFESNWIITYADNRKTLYNPTEEKETSK